MEQELSFGQLYKAVQTANIKLDTIEGLLKNQSNQEPTEKPDQLLTVQQAADFLNLAVPTIYSKVSKGELPVMKRSKRLYFSQTELLDYIKEGRVKTISEIESDAISYLDNK